jgi:lipopolysaccharide export system ATP-binding protein
VTESVSAAPDPESGRGVADSRLEARHLQKAYGGRKVVKDVSLSVQKGEVVGLLGPTARARPPRST